MDELYNVIINIFRNILPGDVIDGKVRWRQIPLDVLRRISYAYDTQNGEVEIDKKLIVLKEQIDFEFSRDKDKKSFELNDLIDRFVEEVLTYAPGEVACHFEKLQTWRKVSNKIDGDIFIASKYAEVDYHNGKTRETFIWPYVIGHNNVQLNSVLEKGMSENHFHLHNSAHYFIFSWLSLMNLMRQPMLIQSMNQLNTERRTQRIRLGQDYKEKDYAVLHIQAAIIRVYLFSCLTGRKIELEEYFVPWTKVIEAVFRHERLDEFTKRYNKLKSFIENGYSKQEMIELQESFPRLYWLVFCKMPEIFDDEELKKSNNAEELYRMLNELRKSDKNVRLTECGWILRDDDVQGYEDEWERQTLDSLERLLKNDNLLKQYHGNLQVIIDSFLFYANSRNKDYAMNEAGSWYKKDKAIVTTIGERWLIYTMLKNLKQKDSKLSSRHYDLFFAYLLIKESFRMELLQNNDRLGFRNFKEYQKRKTWFTTQYTVSELARSAVETTFNNQEINSLEIRVKPEQTMKENVKKLRQYDAEIEGARPHYYVFHFSKRPDDTIGMSHQFDHMYYRHYQLRKEIRRQMNALLELRRKNPEYAKMVRGIDACSDEDGCRPEVCAIIFRVLRHHSRYQKIRFEPNVPQLKATYHVGEVFQDIVDGLRAIDEAVLFLNLDCGDRLGHATVLGMNVDSWYREKGYMITIRQQDYLDNIVWMYHKLLQYELRDIAVLLAKLDDEFQLYFSMIYGKALESNYIDSIIKKACEHDEEYGTLPQNESIKIEFDIHTYYYSWMLRGDHPELYKEGYYKKNRNITSLWDRYSVNRKFPEEKHIRYILPAAILNHYYHYSTIVKNLGNVPVTRKISMNMVRVIARLQKELQREIANRDIAIETNPSSNVMISNLKSYAEHPITTFYNKSLVDDYEKLAECEQLNVSINTDNQGVYSTSLSNEYALMASALSELRDENGKRLYKKANIYDWIDNVREMGNRQSFMSKE